MDLLVAEEVLLCLVQPARVEIIGTHALEHGAVLRMLSHHLGGEAVQLGFEVLEEASVHVLEQGLQIFGLPFRHDHVGRYVSVEVVEILRIVALQAQGLGLAQESGSVLRIQVQGFLIAGQRQGVFVCRHVGVPLHHVYLGRFTHHPGYAFQHLQHLLALVHAGVQRHQRIIRVRVAGEGFQHPLIHLYCLGHPAQCGVEGRHPLVIPVIPGIELQRPGEVGLRLVDVPEGEVAQAQVVADGIVPGIQAHEGSQEFLCGGEVPVVVHGHGFHQSVLHLSLPVL